MEKEKNFRIFVTDKQQVTGFELVRSDEGKLIADIKKKSRDKNVPKHVEIEAIEVIDQIVAAMNMEERMQAYRRLLQRIHKVEN